MSKKLILLNAFGNEFVEITCRKMSMTATQQNAEEMLSNTIPVTIRGFFVDVDEQFVYLSDTDEENSIISQAIPIDEIGHIKVLTEKDVYDELLEETGNEKPDKGHYN